MDTRVTHVNRSPQHSGFSIHDRVVSSAHRDFYERITADLGMVVPICNQGKCRAIEISSGASERDQLIALMKRAEGFAGRLIEVSQKLFADVYQSKWDFARSVQLDTAYNLINLMDRNLLERTCDVRWWALETSFSQCLEQLEHDGAELEQAVDLACMRLEDIRRSYTLYRDLVLVSADGEVLASSNPQRRAAVLGLKVSDERWFRAAMRLSDGTRYHAEDLAPSALEPDTLSLIYSAAVRRDSSVNGQALGVLGILFDFQNEARQVIDAALPQDADERPPEGWHSLITNRERVVIASSDEDLFPLGSRLYLPRSHRELGKGQRACSVSNIGGRESVVYSAATDGYLDYDGLGWVAHLVVEQRAIFEKGSASRDQLDQPVEPPIEQLIESTLVDRSCREAFDQVQDDKLTIQRIAFNGIIFASRLGKRGSTLGPVFEEITRIGDSVTQRMEQLLGELVTEEAAFCKQVLARSALQAMDLIDRNLFERAADVRWWATDAYFWQALEQGAEPAFRAGGERLRVIQDSYTMYRNLVLLDGAGRVVACSDSAQHERLAGVEVGQAPWFAEAMASRSSTQYVAADVNASTLEPDQASSLIFAAGVRRGGRRSGESIGALATLFDWDLEAEKILQACLPTDQLGQPISGCLAVFTSEHGRIIQSTEPMLAAAGDHLPIPEALSRLATGQTGTAMLQLNGRSFLIGSGKSRGYREYAGLGWMAHVLRPL